MCLKGATDGWTAAAWPPGCSAQRETVSYAGQTAGLTFSAG